MCVTIRTMVYYTFELLLTLLCLCIYNNVKLRPWILQWLPMQEVLYIISESASLFEITHINQMCVISNVSFRRSYNNIRHIYIHTCSTFKTSGSLRPANGVGEPWMWAVTWWAVALSPRPRAETTEGEGERERERAHGGLNGWHQRDLRAVMWSTWPFWVWEVWEGLTAKALWSGWRQLTLS